MDTVNMKGDGVELDMTTQRARAAVSAFRALVPTLSSYATALSGKSVQVVPHPTSNGHTDGKTIYYRPPIALGDLTPHDRSLCEKRDPDTGLMECPACANRETVLVAIYHEIAHIAFDSFKQGTDKEKRQAIESAISIYGSEYGKFVESKIKNVPASQRGNVALLASLVSQYLPKLINALEDARIEESMFRVRRGTRRMFNADNRRTFTTGVEKPDGSLLLWKERPLNAQAIIALYTAACGYEYQTWFHPKVVTDLATPKMQDLIERVRDAKDALGIYAISFNVLAALKELGYCEEEAFDPPKPDPEPEEQSDVEAPSDEQSSEQEAGSGGSDSESDEADGGGDSGVPSSDDDSVDGDDSGDDAPSESEAGGPEGDGEEPAPDSSGDSAAGAGGPDGASSGSGGRSPQAPERDTDGDTDGNRNDAPDHEDGTGTPNEGSEEAEEASSSGSRASDHDGPEHDPTDSSTDGTEGVGDAGDDGDSSLAPSGDDRSGSSDDPVPGDDPVDRDEQPGGPIDPGAGEPGGPGDAGLDAEDSPPSDDLPDAGEGDRDDIRVDRPASAEPDGSSDEMGSRESAPTDGEAGDEPTAKVGEKQADPRSASEVEETGDFKPIELIEKEENDHIDYGSFEDVEDVIDLAIHKNDLPDYIEEQTSAEQESLAIAVIQGAYFETPSRNILGVREHLFGQPILSSRGENMSIGWDLSHASLVDARRRDGRGIDLDIPEADLAPALRRLRVLFAENKRARHEKHLKSGRVDGRVLAKRGFLDDERLFKRKFIPGKKDYFVVLAWDISGSNRGQNIILGKRAVMAQAILMHRLGVKFVILAHTGTLWEPESGRAAGMALDVYHIKDEDEPFDKSIVERMQKIGPAAANLDGHALEYMRRLCDTRREERRIIMYYSDGKMPAENKAEELVILKREIKACRKRGYTLVGVGINTDSPTEHGLETVMVKEEADIVNVVAHLEHRLNVR